MMGTPETSRPFGLWQGQPTLSRRLATTMLLALVAIQCQAFLQISYFSRPEIRLIGIRWLSETAGYTARDAFALPAEARSKFLAERGERSRVQLHWRQGPPPDSPNDSDRMIGAQLAATIRDVMGVDLKSLHIRVASFRFRFPTMMIAVTAAADEVSHPPDRQPVQAGAPDVLIHAGIRVSLQGHDGSWIDAEPLGFKDEAFGIILPWAPLVVMGLIIAAVSTWTARRMMAPLDRLVIAAERLGAAREPVRVDPAGLHEFAGVARAFEEMQQRLLRFVEDRTRILAAISHDLRTSLTRLSLAAEQCGVETERAALEAEIEEMRTMVDSTIAFASGEAQLAPNQSTDVAAMLISLIDEASDQGKVCSYDGPDHAETMAHPVSLKRAFHNVIDNASKYGAVARVRLAQDGRTIQVSFDDDGPGIPAKHHNDVFVPFRRLDPARGHEIPGVGLGLTIARDVIQSHGGTIELINLDGGGLRVSITLPRR